MKTLADVVGAALALALGAGIGFIATFTHRQFPVGPVPLGLIAGLLLVAALIVGLRLVFPGRLVALAAASGVLAAIAVLSLPGAGGSLMVVADPVGYTWAIGPVVIAAVAAAWPEPRHAPSAHPAAGRDVAGDRSASS